MANFRQMRQKTASVQETLVAYPLWIFAKPEVIFLPAKINSELFIRDKK